MAATSRPSTTTTVPLETPRAGAPNSSVAPGPEESTAPANPFGEEIPTEEGGMVALAGWSVATAAFGVGLALAVVYLVFRRRRTRRTATEIAQRAVSDLAERAPQTSRQVRRRIARRISAELEAAV